MRRIRNVFLGFLAVFGAGAFVFAQFQPKFAEYEISTITTMTTTEPTAHEKHRSTLRTYFGRRDGSKGVRTTERVNQRTCTTTTIWDRAKREEATWSDCVGMKSSVPLSSYPPAPAVSLSDCANFLSTSKLVASTDLSGLKAEAYCSDTPSSRSTVFAVPSLGCLQIRSHYEWKDATGRVQGTTVEEPVRVSNVLTSALFDVPSSLREVVPSERRDAHVAFLTGRRQIAPWSDKAS